MRKVGTLTAMFLYSMAYSATVFGAEASRGFRDSFRVLSLNLHAYHPFGQDQRYLETRETGVIKKAKPHIFYFSPEELRRGSRERDRRLIQDLKKIDADILVFQEVASGWGESNKNCQQFYSGNTVVALAQLAPFLGKAHSACRGNIGWITSGGLFSKHRVLAPSAEGYRVVFDYGADPYPSGLVIEGMAVVVRSPFVVRANLEERIPTHSFEEDHFFQAVEIQDPSGAWILLLNLHLPHKLKNFEASVALRGWIDSYVERHSDAAAFLGHLVVGDFNAYREESAMEAWSLSSEMGRGSSFPAEELSRQLMESNDDMEYKPWASIWPREHALSRINSAIDALRELWERGLPHLVGAVDWNRLENDCADFTLPGVSRSCSRNGRIDFIKHSSGFRTRRASVLYPETTFMDSLDQLSDHPAVLAELEALEER